MARRNDILERKEEILQWISESLPKAEIARRLKCKPDTLNSYLEKMGIEYKGNMGKKGLKSAPNKKTFDELSQVSTVTSHRLRLRLLEEGIKEHKCECCGKTEWPEKDVLLQLVLTTPMTKIGEQYGVSDNAVRKWCKHYNIPSTKKEIKEYLENSL